MPECGTQNIFRIRNANGSFTVEAIAGTSINEGRIPGIVFLQDDAAQLNKASGFPSSATEDARQSS